MLTGILAWATLFAGVAILTVALRARRSADRTRIGLVALLYSLWSAIALAVLLGTENPAASPALSIGNGAVFALSTCLGMVAALCLSRRVERSPIQAAILPGGSRSLWQAIVEATTADCFLDEMLFDVAEILRSATQSRAAHVFKISRARRRAIRIGTVTPAGSATPLPVGVSSDEDSAARVDLAWRAAADRDLVADSSRVAVPLDNDETVLAVVVFDDPAIDHRNRAARRMLLDLGVIVGRAIAGWTEGTMGATYGTLCNNLRATLPALARIDRFERGLPVVAASLRGVLGCDYLSIAWLNRARFHEDRASIVLADDNGSGGRVVEKRHRWPIVDSTTRRVLALRRALITPDLRMAAVDDSVDGEPWECRLGMRSRLIAPIFDGADVVGAITVAHRHVAQYGQTETQLLAVVADVLSLWLRGLQAAREVDRARAVEAFVHRLWEGAAPGSDDAALLNEAKQLLDVSGLRLYRCNADTLTLEEVAAAGRVGHSAVPRRLPLDQLPWHRWALDSGRPLRVDQGDPESLMSPNEAQLALAAAFKTGCVVPITAGGRWLGVLDVLEMRDPDRSCLDRLDQFLLQALAAALANRWTDRLHQGRDLGRSPTWEMALKELNREIVNPLTSIIGSAELIRHKQPDLRPDTIKYLRTIEQSAARVHESTSDFMTRMGGKLDLRPDRHADDAGRRPARLTRPASLLEATDELTGRASTPPASWDRDVSPEWRPTAAAVR